ncbi:protein LURP-one-related 8-like [Phalaenopsis equestris]|uniref:protein LURP-one-related 8-like n=1 Tax=Phalaenopsis equestris TaxID=78828 RepID=UPI0009E23B3B|nr:protein LURP-one-related 8-like [Phalaenopsis equestris]
MTKIYPNLSLPKSPASSISISAGEEPAVLTVWRKSLLFNCSGFTVYDSTGNLLYRVDNYSLSSLNEIVLMDAIGKPLYTVRRKRFTLTDQWNIYKGEAVAAPRPIFSARKHVSLVRSKSLAHVIPCSAAGKFAEAMYDVEGSFAQRSCVVYDESHKPVAEIQRKETVGDDVFRLVVQPGFDAALAMAFVILLERMCVSRVASIKG